MKRQRTIAIWEIYIS